MPSLPEGREQERWRRASTAITLPVVGGPYGPAVRAGAVLGEDVAFYWERIFLEALRDGGANSKLFRDTGTVRLDGIETSAAPISPTVGHGTLAYAARA